MSGSNARALNDPAYVREQYASENGLAARKSLYRDVQGPDVGEIVFAQIAAVSPTRVLEAGCGEGELAEHVARELGAEVVAVDQSERMVELTRARGVDAHVGDVQALPFRDGSFDVVVAAWMLYHVPELDRGLAELARVLRPRGRLVAGTNATDHLLELRRLGGLDRWDLPFGAENGEELLRSHFAQVERIDASGTVVVHDIDAVRSYFASSERLSSYLDRLPVALDEPLVVRRRPVVFVATKV